MAHDDPTPQHQSTFGSGNTVSDVTVGRDVAGRDIVYNLRADLEYIDPDRTRREALAALAETRVAAAATPPRRVELQLTAYQIESLIMMLLDAQQRGDTETEAAAETLARWLALHKQVADIRRRRGENGNE